MPPALVKATKPGQGRGEVLPPAAFANDAKLVEFLFELYERYVGGCLRGRNRSG